MRRTAKDRSEDLLRSASPATSLAYMGSILSVLVSAEQTEGGLFVMIVKARQGNEPPPHVHLREHEVYFMLDGAIEVHVEGCDGSLRATVGQSVLLPRGRAHAVVYETPTIEALVVYQAVAWHRIGSERYFAQLAEGPAASMTLPRVANRYSNVDAATLTGAAALAEENGIAFLTPEDVRAKLPAFADVRRDG